MAMHHTMIPPHVMVHLMNNPQITGQCPPSPHHALQINGVNTILHEYTQRLPDLNDHNTRHRMIQLTGVDMQPVRRGTYNNIQNSNGVSPGHWQRRTSHSNNAPTIPPPHLEFRTAGTIKKPNWNNKGGKRTQYRDSFAVNEVYNSSDSGFSSRSPTPNKHQIDSSQTESSDERDSIASSAEQSIKRLHEVYRSSSAPNNNNNNSNVHNNNIIHPRLISSAPAQQFYQHQRPVTYYHSSVPSPRPQAQSYQNKRRYQSGRNSPPTQRTQRARKFNGIIVPSFNMLPRCTIAPDRFLARSHLVAAKETPRDLTTGSVWDNLSRGIWEKFMSNQQTEETYKKKMLLWKCLYIFIKSTFPKYGLFLVGSTMNGFGSNNSDVDMCLLVRHTEMDQRNEAIGHLEQILKCLKGCESIQRLELIQAKVPILKFHDATHNLEVDLNCNNAVGIRNTHLLYCYSRIDWRVRPLVLIVKLWAQCQNINDAKNMTISSYSLVLMVIHFLQCGVSPSVLPCLHSLYAGKFGPHSDIHCIDIHEDLDLSTCINRPANRQTLGELLVEFFKYYVTFNFSQYAISVRLADKVPIAECQRARSYKNEPHQWKYLCIEEPFDLTNTARSVYDPIVFAKIKRIFARSYERLKKNRDLSSIFVKLDTSKPYVAT